jgi:predicted RNase H-like HicB family nuclease
MTSSSQRSVTEIPRVDEMFYQGSTTESTENSILERLETLTNQTGQLRVDVQERPVKYNSQIRDLGDEGFTLNETLIVSIEEYSNEDTYIASFPEIEVFGEGSTEAEALMNLKCAILDLYDELIDTSPDELGDLPKAWLLILKKIIKENN